MNYIKKAFALFFALFLFFCSHNMQAMINETPSGSIALKRRSQLTAALLLFKNRIKKNNFLAPGTLAPVALPPKQLSQTEAYMSRFKNELEAHWGHNLKKYDAMIQKIIAREKEHNDTHYAFYHAHRTCIRLIHDVIQELYRFFFQDAQLSHFRFVRFWKDHSPFSSAHAFLDHYNKQTLSKHFDCNLDIAQQLLSVNLSLFSNRTFFGEGTFEFFLRDNSYIADWFESYLEKLFTRLGIDQKWAQPLMNLTPDLCPDDSRGHILQIFIPKKDVDRYIYTSKAYGIPHGPIAAAAPNMAFNTTLKRHKSIIPILESYQKSPFEMDACTYDQIQARLILTADIFNPKSNVKTYRYSAMAKTDLAAYKKKLRDIMTSALDEWCATYANTATLPNDLAGTKIDTMLKTIT